MSEVTEFVTLFLSLDIVVLTGARANTGMGEAKRRFSGYPCDEDDGPVLEVRCLRGLGIEDALTVRRGTAADGVSFVAVLGREEAFRGVETEAWSEPTLRCVRVEFRADTCGHT